MREFMRSMGERFRLRRTGEEKPPLRSQTPEARPSHERTLADRAREVMQFMRRKALLATALLGIGCVNDLNRLPAPGSLHAVAEKKPATEPGYKGQAVRSEDHRFQRTADGWLDAIKQSWQETKGSANLTAFFVDERGAEGDGKNAVEYNPLYPLLPAQLTFTRESVSHGLVGISVQEPWAPHFAQSHEAYTPMGTEADAETRDAMAQGLLNAIGDEVRWWNADLGKDPDTRSHKVDVESVEITFTASPEGAAVGSEAIGAIEPENLETAAAREQAMRPAVEEALRESGVPEAAVRGADISLEETQFTEDETFQLLQLAQREGFNTGSDDQKIHDLVRKYNRGEIISPSTNDALDEIVAGKRGMQVRITTAERAVSETNLPLPLGIFALSAIPLFCRLDRRRRDPRSPRSITLPPPPVGEPVGTPPRPPLQRTDAIPPVHETAPGLPVIELPPDEVSTRRAGDHAGPGAETPSVPSRPEVVWATRPVDAEVSAEALAAMDAIRLPDRSSDEYRGLLLETVGGDLFVYLGDTTGRGTVGSQEGSSAIKDGIDYESLVELGAERLGSRAPQRTVVNELAVRILEAWRLQAQRHGGGWSADHEEQQMRWAKIHATVLTQLAESFRALPKNIQEENMSIRRLFERDTQYILADWAKVLEQRCEQALRDGRLPDVLLWESRALRVQDAITEETRTSGSAPARWQPTLEQVVLPEESDTLVEDDIGTLVVDTGEDEDDESIQKAA